MSGGFGCWMHSVLGHFVDASWRRLLMEAEELIERSGTFAGLVGLLDRFGDVGLGENRRFAKLLTACELRGQCGGERAAGAVRVRAFHVIAAERIDSRSIAQHIDRPFQVSARYDHRSRAHLKQFLPGRLHTGDVLYFHSG